MKAPVGDQESQLDEIYKITSLLLESDDLALNDLLGKACQFLSAESGIICHIKSNKYQVLEYFSSDEGQNFKGHVFDLKETFCEFTIKENKIVAVNDIKNSKLHKNHLSSINYGLASYIGIPIHFNENEIGTLNFSSKKHRDVPFNDSEKNFVQYLSQWVSNYFDRIYYKKAIQDKNMLLQALNKEFELQNKELKDIMTEKNQLMQILVHDLKSPLSNIQMLSYLFQEFATSPDTEELVNIFNKSLKDMLHLIEQMETLNRVENFELSNFIEEFDLNSFLSDNLKNFNASADAKSITLNYNAEGEDFMIATDQNFLKRIFNNLLSNALKFSPFRKEIAINLVKESDQFRISITDQGPGISDKDKEKLFTKFSTLGNKPTNNESSSGLGLFIVKELAKHLQGDLEVKSTLGKGSTFSIYLPLQLTV